ncbi:hypothetical protein AZZ73_005192, partial [Klebsiella pneumoniae]
SENGERGRNLLRGREALPVQPESGHTAQFVRAGLSTTNGCKPAMNVPVPIICNLQHLWMKIR